MINKIKRLLSITDDKQDDLLNDLIELCEVPILNRIQEDVVPKRLQPCLIEFVIVRYNRLNSEGYASEGVEGGSISFVNNYMETIEDEIEAYISFRDNKKARGIKFI